MKLERFGSAVAAFAMAAMIAGPASAQEVIKIGSSLPLTGGFAVTGQKHKEGFEMCIKMINDNGGLLGRQVELIKLYGSMELATKADRNGNSKRFHLLG